MNNMQMHFSSGDSGLAVTAVLAGLFSIAMAVFWMVVGWRAMRAHERIADATEQTARKSREGN
jgi:uncharacterized membrane protein YciS (DUF1049 family)